jgi:LysM repeat protein
MSLSEKWKKTVDDGLTNALWDAYDTVITAEVSAYNTKFANSKGYHKIDWKLIKAVVWVESGGPTSPAWKARVMQIGNPGDPALAVLKGAQEGADLIMSEQLKKDIVGKINEPEVNVKAGIAYLVTRLAKSEFQSVVDALDSKTFSYTVVAGDSLDKIALKVGSTIDVLKKLNPTVKVLQPKQTILCQKAKIKRVLTGWLPCDSANIARRYNVGDPNYSAKLDYVVALLGKLKR